MHAGSTRYASLPPWPARAVLALLVMLLAWGLYRFVGHPESIPQPVLAASDEEGDLALHQAILGRVHGGENYYDVAQHELRRRNFPSCSPFNYRLPTLAWALRVLPSPAWGRLALVVLAAASLVLWVRVLRQLGASLLLGVAGGLLLCGPLGLASLPEGTAFPELWAGILLGLSLATHARGHEGLAVALGTAALLMRELVLPYAVVMLVLSWSEGRRREAVGWLAGLTLFVMLLAWHAFQVWSRASDLDQLGDPWLYLGGWPFVIATARWNAYLQLAPAWVTVVVLPFALLGLAGWRGPVGTRVTLTVGAYVGAYLIVGRPDNHYWGMLYGPLLPLGLVLLPASLADLKHAARSAAKPS